MFTDRVWKKPEEAIMHIFPEVNWNAIQFQLRGIDYDRRAILLGKGGHQQHERWAGRPGTTLGKTSRYYIENVFEELNCPGEWYYNRDDKDLYYLPEENEDLSTITFEIPLLKEIIRFEGEKDNCVRNLEFKGLHFVHSKRMFYRWSGGKCPFC